MFLRPPGHRARNKSDKVIVHVNHVCPYLFLGFIVEKRFGMPINGWIRVDLVPMFERLPIEEKN
jgi:hypothetical protein